MPKLDVIGIDQKEIVLKDLTQDQNYEIIVYPFNSQGLGPPSSPPIAVYVGEAVPTGDFFLLPFQKGLKQLSCTQVNHKILKELRFHPPKSDSNGKHPVMQIKMEIYWDIKYFTSL